MMPFMSFDLGIIFRFNAVRTPLQNTGEYTWVRCRDSQNNAFARQYYQIHCKRQDDISDPSSHFPVRHQKAAINGSEKRMKYTTTKTFHNGDPTQYLHLKVKFNIQFNLPMLAFSIMVCQMQLYI
jgi:hypothetical protein